MFTLDSEKVETLNIILQTYIDYWSRPKNFKRESTSALYIIPSPLTMYYGKTVGHSLKNGHITFGCSNG